MTIHALKEWGAAVHALLDGRQTVLLRKGGIHEKRFEIAVGESGREFVLFPTVAHSHAQRVRPEHRDLLSAGAADSTDDHVTVRAGAKVVAAVTVNRPERINEVEDLHIWTAESVQAERLDFRPRHRLTVLVVQAQPLIEPVRLPRLPHYAGCKSWVDLPVNVNYGTPVHNSSTLGDIAERVRRSVG